MYPRRRYCSIPPSTELMSPTYGLFVFLLRAFPSHTIFQLSYAKYGSTYAPPDSVELEKEFNLWCNLDTPLFKQRRMQFFCPIWAKGRGTNFRPNYVSYDDDWTAGSDDDDYLNVWRHAMTFQLLFNFQHWSISIFYFSRLDSRKEWAVASTSSRARTRSRTPSSCSPCRRGSERWPRHSRFLR